MEKKRTLIINSAVCDAREVREETLAACDVVINSGLVLANREARDLLNRYSVTINGGDLLDAQGEGVLQGDEPFKFVRAGVGAVFFFFHKHSLSFSVFGYNRYGSIGVDLSAAILSV